MNEIFTPKLRIKCGEVMGYGGPGYHWTQGTYNNKLIFYIKDRADNATVYKEQIKWEKEWPNEEAFLKAIKNNKLASPWCDQCGGDTLDACISCINKNFCLKCEPFIDAHKKKHAFSRLMAQPPSGNVLPKLKDGWRLESISVKHDYKGDETGFRGCIWNKELKTARNGEGPTPRAAVESAIAAIGVDK